jgi:hypothetical protein
VATPSFKLGVVGAGGGRDCGRRAKRSGSRTANTTIGVESESIVGGSEMVYSRRRRQRKAKTDAFCVARLGYTTTG